MASAYPAEDIIEELDPELIPYFGPSGQDVREGRYASSFIAPNVTAHGEVLSPAVEEHRDFASEQAAVKARGQQEFESLVKAGASFEEAYLRTAHLLNPPNKIVDALSKVPHTESAMPFVPRKVKQDGDELWQLGPNRWQLKQPPKDPAIPPAAKIAQEALQRQINEAYKAIDADYRTATKPDADPDAKSAAARRVVTLRERVGELEAALQKGSTNWMAQPPTSVAQKSAMPGAPTQPIAPPPAEVVEVVRVTKDGRKAVYDASTKQFLRYQ